MTRICSLAALALFGATWANGGILTQVNTRAALGGNDFVDWGQLGPDFTTVTSPFNVTSNLGLGPNAVVNGTQDFFSIQEGNTWGGNFAAGDNVLFNQASGPFTITFASPIHGAGLQFQSATFGPFTASITAFGAGNINFGTVTRTGTSSNAADNSAIFLGVISSLNDIVSLQFDLTIPSPLAPTEDPNGFGVNRLDLVDNQPTPEPSVIALFSTGLGLFALLRKGRP